MRVKKIRGAMKTLFALDRRIGRGKWRTIEASERKLTRDELVRRLAVAESKAGRAWKMISVYIPGEGEDVTPDSFTWHLDWAKIREARRNDEGTYLLRTNLTDCAPKTLWKKYMIQGEIEYAFREMKHDLGLRPVYHRLDDRIEAHIFTSFMAFCLLTTLRAMAREHAPGLTTDYRQPENDQNGRCRHAHYRWKSRDPPSPCRTERRSGFAFKSPRLNTPRPTSTQDIGESIRNIKTRV